MKTNKSAEQSEVSVAKVIPVRFAVEVASRVAVRQQPALAWVPRRPEAHRSARPTLQLFAALLMALLTGATVPSAKAALANTATDLAVLVVTATPNDAALPAIRQALDFLGTPYTVHVASAQPGTLTAEKLFAGTRGFYSSVMLTDSQLAYSPDGVTWASALTTAEWATLNQYEADFAVRRVNWSGYPTPETGFNWPTAAFDSTGNAAVGTWSAAAKPSFPYLVTANAFAVSNVWTYLATPLDSNTTVWLGDAQGHALVAVKKFADGREVLSMTFDNAPWLLHSTVLSHGLVTWANRGMFLGERHTYLSAQIDDVFLADEMWPSGEFRQSAKDWQATINWQAKFRTRTLGKNFRYDMVFNGLGTVPGEYENDDLTPFVKTNKSMFKWISHTYTHLNLDAASYAASLSEVTKNNQAATSLGLPGYNRANLVTGQISGLSNPQFIKAAYDAGIRYLVSDTSIPSHRPASPNVGVPNFVDPRILMIPRHANNLFYNVSTPAEWASEYNHIYNAYWGRDLSYAEILDNQAELLLGFLLKGDISPLMFHQPNLRDYNGAGNTLLGDLLDAVANKYEKLYNFPALSPTMNTLAVTLQRRSNYNASGVVATRNANNTVTLTVTKAARIPVTGLTNGGIVSFTGTTTPAITAETYAGQRITYVNLAAGQSVTVKKL
ncbi:MAG: hypothetical protein B9S33_20735 [Pedosphaera sp. Tous-C6FEB]|nr:MAG: hypothetical protein B9S33_20735 [Pedosphaera sp. Tous-C6FEB]